MTPRAEIRVVPPGNDTHLEEVWKVKERIHRSDGALKQPRAYFEKEYRQQTVYLLLSADDRDEAVAFAVIHADGYLSLFGVVPEQRRQGLGTQLVENLLNDYPTISCHTRASNQAAVEFYKHSGFTVGRRIAGYYREGTDALYLEHDWVG